MPVYNQSIRDTQAQVHDLNARGKDICKIMIQDLQQNGFADEFKYIIETNEKLNGCLAEEILHLKKTTNQQKMLLKKVDVKDEDLSLSQIKIKELQSHLKQRNIINTSIQIADAKDRTFEDTRFSRAFKRRFNHSTFNPGRTAGPTAATPYRYESELGGSQTKIMESPKTNSKQEGDGNSSTRYDLNRSIKSITGDTRLRTAGEYNTVEVPTRKFMARRNVQPTKSLNQVQLQDANDVADTLI